VAFGGFLPDAELPLSGLSSQMCGGYYQALRTRDTKYGKPLAVDSHRNILAEAKTFLNWAVGRGYLRGNPLAGVVGTGKRRHGKPQLRIDEARKWQAKALQLASEGQEGAVGALVTLLMGLRAGEVVSRIVRDLDDDGRLLCIPDSKTAAGKRTLQVPEALRSSLLRLAEGRKAGEPLFREPRSQLAEEMGGEDLQRRRVCRESRRTACAVFMARLPLKRD
jgi:integrase